MKKTLKVEGMSCGHCEKAVKEALREDPSVLDVKVDLLEGKVEVTGDNLEDKRLKEAIDEAGYQVMSIN
ncbi:MAG: heavy-metal-associated domain-containing protein [Tissierella sp.]|uniref:heavy-metal-associated domain-containing protein n=1 Tax=Tissierella sp. TaxID=41274 RepID=UPI003F946272